MTIERLVSLPPAVAALSPEARPRVLQGWFVASDPPGGNLGSGGGTVHLLRRAWQAARSKACFSDWLQVAQTLVVHGGGESRRLPAYSVLGKPLIPLPSSQHRPRETLLSRQSSFYESVLRRAPWAQVMVTSGDVLIQGGIEVGEIPCADIVVLGVAGKPETAQDFGALFADQKSKTRLITFLQKPSPDESRERIRDTRLLIDSGAWLLGPRAIQLMLRRAGMVFDKEVDSDLRPFDLYAGIGPALGSNPAASDEEVNRLSVSVIELVGAEFIHVGSTRQMVQSLGGRDETGDSRPIIINSRVDAAIPAESNLLWIADSAVPPSWRLHGGHVVTRIPENSWSLSLEEGVCLDVVPITGGAYAVRGYGLEDDFRGRINSAIWFGKSATEWFSARSIDPRQAGVDSDADIYESPLFPVISPREDSARIQWFLARRPDTNSEYAEWWIHSRRLSARQLLSRVDAAAMIKGIETATTASSSLTAIADTQAVQRAIVESALTVLPSPRRNVLDDQIVWSRCPVRLDLAGGWTDTPPYCLWNGGTVLNAAVELNGQPPIQVFAKLSPRPEIVIRSIDLGSEERITDFDVLGDYANPRSDFSLARAALCVAGLHPRFSGRKDDSLARRLEDLGGGIEVSLLAAVPQGSGLGTSSILALTLLGALSDVYDLGWNRQDLLEKTLAVEQLVTTGGGWQDQAGALFPGVKLLQSRPGIPQIIESEMLPNSILTAGGSDGSVLLYYTGLTRLAKGILQEVVSGMLASDPRIGSLLTEIEANAREGAAAIRRNDPDAASACIRESWRLNQALDPGTNPPAVQAILRSVEDNLASAKLLGAGGGGYLLMFAKDAEAGRRVRQALLDRPPNSRARFVQFAVSATGLETTRS